MLLVLKKFIEKTFCSFVLVSTLALSTPIYFQNSLLLKIAQADESQKSQSSVEGNFNRAIEFPNYFLSEEFRSLAPEQMGKLSPEKKVKLDKEIIEMRGLLEAALGSIFSRVTIPVVKEGETSASLVRYFEYITNQIKK